MEAIDIPKGLMGQQPFTTTNIRDLIVQETLDFYSYNETGSGCLFWVAALLRAMEKMGFIKSGATEYVTQKVRALRDAKIGDLYIPPNRGDFKRRPELNDLRLVI